VPVAVQVQGRWCLYAEGQEEVSKPGLYANIHAKRKRGEKMRKPGDKGAPTDEAFERSAKTAKKKGK
jgi:hypothetical protein